MKGFVYILQSEVTGRYYIGSTGDIDRRVAEHNAGKTKSLKYLTPLKLVSQQEFPILDEARQMELKLKKHKSRKILEQIINDQVIKMGL